MECIAKFRDGVRWDSVYRGAAGGKMGRIAIVGLTVLLMATRAFAQTEVPGPAPTPAQPSPRAQPTHDQLMALAQSAFGPRGRNLSYREAHPDCSTHIQKDEGTCVAVRALNRPSCTWLWEHDEE